MEVLPKATICKLARNKKLLENRLKVKIEIKNSIVEFAGDELDIYVAGRVIEAISKNFPINKALLLLREDYVLEEVPIKSATKRRNLSVIRARIIGTKGKTLKTISILSDCSLTLQDNVVSILGPAENVKSAVTAIKSIIKGSKQSNVYYYLEQAKKPVIGELKLESEE